MKALRSAGCGTAGLALMMSGSIGGSVGGRIVTVLLSGGDGGRAGSFARLTIDTANANKLASRIKGLMCPPPSIAPRFSVCALSLGLVVRSIQDLDPLDPDRVKGSMQACPLRPSAYDGSQSNGLDNIETGGHGDLAQ